MIGINKPAQLEENKLGVACTFMKLVSMKAISCLSLSLMASGAVETTVSFHAPAVHVLFQENLIWFLACTFMKLVSMKGISSLSLSLMASGAVQDKCELSRTSCACLVPRKSDLALYMWKIRNVELPLYLV